MALEFGRKNALSRPGNTHVDMDPDQFTAFAMKLLVAYHAVKRGKECIVPAHAHIVARENARAELAYKDAACGHVLAAETFYPAALPLAVASVT